MRRRLLPSRAFEPRELVCRARVWLRSRFGWFGRGLGRHLARSVAQSFGQVRPTPIQPDAHDGETIREQCKTMGGYFFIRSGTKTLRVEMQEIAMNAPMREGRQARVEGQMVPYGDGYVRS